MSAVSPWETAIGLWTTPPDTPSMIALLLALVLLLVALVPAVAREVPEMRNGTFRLVIGFAAAFLSLGYIAVYLHGGPRIIDATMYILQGRALSHGALAWPVDEPTEAIRGRFLLAHAGHVGGIFPPGFPLLLALGFRLRAPMVIGPLLAMLLIFATYGTARELARNLPAREPIARTAALLSLVSAVLRYHTADTMAHGAAALFVTTAFTAKLYAMRKGQRRYELLSGLALGALVATRPISAIGIGLVLLLLQRSATTIAAAQHSPSSPSSSSPSKSTFVRAAWLLLGSLPGVAFLLWSQHAVTGSFFLSTQRAYYATSDGPPNCFRYGFGAGIGCLFEHREFVRDRLPYGYTLMPALATTFRRLHHHLADVANFELITLLVFVPLFRRAARTKAIVAALLLILFHVLAYTPFYFDGDYPGGGARFFADLIPIEHALVAIGLAWLTREVSAFAYPQRGAALVAASLIGFGVHSVHSHRLLAARDGGRPMFEPDQVTKLATDHGLLYMSTDHGFDLAHDPLPSDTKGFNAVRLRNDDGDRLVYELAGHPPSYRYLFDPLGAPAEPKVEAWTPVRPGPHDPWHFEAESSWPPLAQNAAWAEPVWMDGASNGRGLVVTAVAAVGSTETGSIDLTMPVPVVTDPNWTITPRVLFRGVPGHGELTFETETTVVGSNAPSTSATKWTWDDGPNAVVGARDLPPEVVATFGKKAFAVHLLVQGQVAWDRTFLRGH